MVTPVDAADHRVLVLADVVIERGCVFEVDLTFQYSNSGKRFQWKIP